jgi:hypothetical protein
MADPISAGSCVLWLKANDAATVHATGNRVTQWDDKSGAGRNATPPSSSAPDNRPFTGTRTINGKNVLEFTPSGADPTKLTTATSGISVMPYTMAMVWQSDTGANGTLESPFVVTAGSGFLQKAANNFWQWFAGTYATSIFLRPVDTTAHGFIGTMPSSGGLGTFNVDGAQFTAATSVGSGVPTGQWQLGSATNVAHGVLAEVVAYSIRLSDTQQSSLIDYFRTEWGIPANKYTDTYNGATAGANDGTSVNGAQDWWGLNSPPAVFQAKASGGQDGNGCKQLGTGQGTAGTRVSMRNNTFLQSIDTEVSADFAMDRSMSGIGSGSVLGAILNRKDSTTGAVTGYEAVVNFSNTVATVVLNRVNAGTRTQLGSTINYGVWDTAWHNLKLRASGTNPVHLEMIIDGISYLTYDDSNASRVTAGAYGAVGLQAGGNGAAVAFIDNFLLQPVSGGVELMPYPRSVLLAKAASPGLTYSPPAGYAAWYDAQETSTITQSGGVVSQWNDKSVNNRHLTSRSTGERPTTGTHTITGHPTVTSDGTKLMQSPTFTLAQPYTVCMVLKALVNTGGPNYFFTSIPTGNAMSQYTNLWRIEGGTSGGTQGGSLDFNPHIVSGVWDSTSTQMWVDGTSVVTTNGGTLGFSSDSIGLFAYLLSSAVNGGWTGDIGEVLLYPGHLTTTARQAVEAYLKAKWTL